MKKDSIAGRAFWRRPSRHVEPMALDKSRIDVMQHVRPNLTDVVHLRQRLDGGVPEWVRLRGGRVRVPAYSRGTVHDVFTCDKVRHGRRRFAVQSAMASDQPSPIPAASRVCRQRLVPPPVIRLVIP
jgi:hypothetical protein